MFNFIKKLFKKIKIKLKSNCCSIDLDIDGGEKAPEVNPA